MGNGSASDKARKARNRAYETFGGVSYSKSESIAKANAKAAGVEMTASETRKATNIIQSRRNNDARRTASRATFIAGESSPASKRAAAARLVGGITGAGAKSVSKTYRNMGNK